MKNQIKSLLLLTAGLLTASATLAQNSPKTITFSTPYEFAPPHYICYRAPQSDILIDGDIDTPEWATVPWTTDFIDIQGKNRPVTPRHQCRAKLMWDDHNLYIAAEMIEPHLWATHTQRESVIFQDNDFEVFLDVTGSTHHYMEYEVNALGTEWDLMLTRPYRDNGAPLNSWNMNGLRSAVKLYGTLNTPSDTDQKWTFEMSIPLNTLTEIRHGGKISDGQQWRLNFSRVQWQLDIQDGRYVKRPNSPEDNWVWAPSGKISIHEPEYWGYLQFSTTAAGQGTAPFVWNPNEDIKWALRQLYFRQREYRSKTGQYAASPTQLNAQNIHVKNTAFTPTIHLSGDTFRITAPGFGGTTWYINSDGYVGQGK